jgi:hypothetical protein
MCRLSRARTALSLCAAADAVVLIAATSPEPAEGADVWSGPAQGQPAVLQTGDYNILAWANVATAADMRTYLAGSAGARAPPATRLPGRPSHHYLPGRRPRRHPLATLPVVRQRIGNLRNSARNRRVGEEGPNPTTGGL